MYSRQICYFKIHVMTRDNLFNLRIRSSIRFYFNHLLFLPDTSIMLINGELARRANSFNTNSPRSNKNDKNDYNISPPPHYFSINDVWHDHARSSQCRVNTKHRTNVGLMLGQHRRHWLNVCFLVGERFSSPMALCSPTHTHKPHQKHL